MNSLRIKLKKMQNKNTLYSLIFLLFLQIANAQQPQKLNAVEIYNQILKLNFLGSVLYIAAHPDDENTKLISYFSNENKARTGYLSLTRGDGGQNLIGPQLRELLGVIRTQELLEARKIDGGEQFFSRANDFGFSKNATETLEIWDKNKVLSDVVWAIRKFQPDVIINRFDHRTSGNTHGHHSASAILSFESFNLANDPNAFPEQLKWVQPWQTKRQFFNTSWWFYGTKEKYDAADKSKMMTIPIGVYYPSIGKSNQEIAALSRSRHQSQGFGTTGNRNEEIDYLECINGENPTSKTAVFEGIDTSWNRVKGGKPIGILVSKIISQFDYNNPSASIPDLAKAYLLIQSLEDEHWKTIKTAAIKDLIVACSGLYLEAVAKNQEACPGSKISVTLEAINRSSIAMQFVGFTTLPDNKTILKDKPLNNSVLENSTIEIQLPENLKYTQPYWLEEKGTNGMYSVNNQENIGIPDIIREVKIVFNIRINEIEIPIERTIVYKYNDGVKGEMYNYLDIVPIVTSTFADKVSLFTNNKSKEIAVKITSGKDAIQGNIKLELPSNWKVSPQSIPFILDKKGSEQLVHFQVSPPNDSEEVIAKSIVIVDNKDYDKDKMSLEFNHITKQQVLESAESKFLRLELKTNSERIGYIMGAGDAVPTSLIQMGYEVTLVKPNEITTEYLRNFDVIITGIRAYNTQPELIKKQALLFDFVSTGKTMLVQYNTPDDSISTIVAPYPLKISGDRVTEEAAEVRFLEPENPVLNVPNKITSKDFEGWKQEQGLYYPNKFDKAFAAILSSNDKGETPKNGSLLVAKYGKGYYIYTGLSLFRELPEGVSGAFRLVSNLISIKN